MSAPDDTPAQVEAEALKRSAVPKAIVVGCAILAVLLAGTLALTRYGVLLPQARVFIEARTDGLKIGRLGRLKISGLSGDLWRDFTIKRLTIRDEKGVWLEAEDVHLVWRYAELFRRRFHATEIEARQVRLVRRPTLTPKGVDRGLPLSFHIDDAHGRVVLEPAFSYRRGVFDVTAQLDVRRKGGGQQGKVVARSALRAGDHLRVDFDIAKTRPLKLVASALETRGGALAGALGLPADRPFAMVARAGGKTSEGQVFAAVATGASVPLRAQGVWTAAEGRGSGRVLLTASTLTSRYASRVGPDVVFAVAGRKAGPSLFDLSLKASAANLSVTIRGLGNIVERRLGPKGLAVDAQAGALSKITGGPQAGPARLTGVLTGTTADWRLAGEAAVTRTTLGGYTLDRVGGPVEVRRRAGVLDVKALATGSGGRGQGWIAAMLGGRPTASVEGSRLADGSILLRSLDVTGDGLKVQASGGRGLLGGLVFKGRAEVSNLAKARADAKGTVTATWQAAKANADAPWTFEADARGARLATGLAELDRLLGGEPRFQAHASVAGGQVAVSEASLTGAALRGTGAGVLEADGALKFKLDWTAEGPFRAGPVEITGHAKGSGAITGTTAAPRADLLADFDAIDVPRVPLKNAHVTVSFLRQPDGSSGVATLAAESAYGPARARSDFRFPPGGVDLTGLDIDAGGVKAAGSLSLRSRAPSAANLTLAVTRGGLLDGGRIGGTARIVDGGGGARGQLNLTAENAVLKGSAIAIRGAQVTADGPLSRLPYNLRADGASRGGQWSVAGRGTISDHAPAYAIAFDGAGRVGKRQVRTTETAIFRIGGPERSARLRLAASEGGRLDLDARVAEAGTEIRARLENLGLGLVDQDLDGQFDATLSLQGRGARLDGTLDAKLDGARGRGSDPSSGLDGAFKARLADSSITIDADLTNPQGLRATADLVLPAEASASPFRVAIARQRPMRGRFFADGEVKPLWDLLIGGERSLSGRVMTEGTLSGTLADPRSVGRIAVDDGRFEDGVTGLALRDVVLRATFDGAEVDVTQATGADGHGGTATGAGRISLARQGVSSFRLDLKGFRLIDNDRATASATGQATINRGADGKVRLAGDLAVDRADISADPIRSRGITPMDVVEINKPLDLESTLRPVTRRGDGFTLDVRLKAPRRVFVRGRGLDVEFSLDAHVRGTTSRPILEGTARVFRGEYDFAGKRFEFDERGVVYLATRARDIRLDLTAMREDPSLTAVVRILGAADKPEVTLTSQPVLPRDEVLSQVLFGRSASQLSPLEAAQLASALSSLAGGGGFDVIGNLKVMAGLDRLALGGGNESGMTVSGGKYLTDDVYLELTGGGREGATAQVEWRVRRNLSIISRLAGQGDAKLSVRWRRDY